MEAEIMGEPPGRGLVAMRCESCLGTGKVLRRSYPGNELYPYPCEVCGGTGFDHCCSGDCVNEAPVQVHPALRVIGDLTPILNDQNGQGLHKKA